MEVYQNFEQAMMDVLVVPHFNDFVASISASEWAAASSNNDKAITWTDLAEIGCLPFGNIKDTHFPIDLTPVFNHMGISDFLEIACLLNRLLQKEDAQNIFLAIESFIFTKLNSMYKEKLPIEYRKWFNKNKCKFSTIIQTSLRRTDAMWKYPILAYLHE